MYESHAVDSCLVDAWPRPVGLRCVQQRSPSFLLCSLACLSAWRVHKSANKSGHTPKGRSSCKDLCQRDSAGGKLHQCKVYYGLLLTLSDLLKCTVVCLAAERKMLFHNCSKRKKGSFLYSANKLLTQNDSLISGTVIPAPVFCLAYEA